MSVLLDDLIRQRADASSTRHGRDVRAMLSPARRTIGPRVSGVGTRHQPTDPSASLEAALGMTPGVGEALSAVQAGANLREGKLGGAALSLAGALPVVGALKRGKAAKRGIEAWHGSPHKFDKFDLSKIGTGEGAQSYGHGLYFAENPEVARSYREKLAKDKFSRRNYRVDGRMIMNDPDADVAAAIAYDKAFWQSQGESIDRDWVNREVGARAGSMFADHSRIRRLIRRYEGRVEETEPGVLHRVRLDTDPSELLDWDAAPDVQPQRVKDALSAIGFKPSKYDESGADIYRAIAGDTRYSGRASGNNQADASAALNRRGVTGIRYLDGGSRGAGEGTRNYVMFDPERIRILETLALAGLVGGGAAAIPPSPSDRYRKVQP